MTLGDFVATYNGKPVDVDQAYGNQCWDLVALYNQLVIGIPKSEGYGLPTGPDLDAKDVWIYFKDPLSQYFDKVQAPFQPGDIIVWGTVIGVDGHIDIFLNYTSSGWNGFDQNWPIGSYAHVQAHNNVGILGGLRPKKGVNMGVITTEAVVALSLGTQGTQPQSPDEYAQWVGKSDQQSWDDLITHYSAKGQARQAALEAQIAGLANGTTLKPGKYIVP